VVLERRPFTAALHAGHSPDTAVAQAGPLLEGNQTRWGTLLIKMARPDRHDVVRVTFVLPAGDPPGAVSVVGDFNDWNPLAHPLRRRTNGTRSVVVRVPMHSTLHFRYLADGGMWFDDETVPVRDPHGAVITV
jgi:1,4-alpha-glucan branching enzyme